MAEKTKRLPLIKGLTTFKIVIPESVEAKIRHLCSIIHDVEWSGTLFYIPEGSIDDGTFKATCVDLFVMDIGSSGYTEYDESPDILTYRVEHDLLSEDIQEGLIHSHNNMSTFFSGTDTNTLIDEGTNCNHFVSLIVNNAGVYTAGVTRKIVTETKAEARVKYTESQYYDTYGDQRVNLKEDQVREEDKSEVNKTQMIEWFELKIEKAEVANNFTEIDARLAEIRANKRKVSKYIPSNKKSDTSRVWYGNSGSTIILNDKKKETTPSYPPPPPTPSIKEDPSYSKLNDFPRLEDEYDYYDSWYDDPWKNYKPQTSVPKASKDPNEDTTPLCLIESFDREMLKSLALQLLTGSIIINEAAIDPKKWVEKMDGIYEKRFGVFDSSRNKDTVPVDVWSNNERLETWIQSMCEFLVHTRDEDLIDRLNLIKGKNYYDEGDTAEICAGDLVSYLDTLPESIVKRKMMECLLTYLPDGAEEYFISQK